MLKRIMQMDKRIIFILVLLVFSLSGTGSALWWNDSYSFQRGIVINNSGSEILKSNYTINLSIWGGYIFFKTKTDIRAGEYNDTAYSVYYNNVSNNITASIVYNDSLELDWLNLSAFASSINVSITHPKLTDNVFSKISRMNETLCQVGFDLDEGSGSNFTDLCRENNNATKVGSWVWNGADGGYIDNSTLNFTGNSVFFANEAAMTNYAYTNFNITDEMNFTIMQWVRQSQHPNAVDGLSVFGGKSSASKFLMLYVAVPSGAIGVYCGGTNNIGTGANYQDNKWHFVSLVVNSSTCTLKVDNYENVSIARGAFPNQDGWYIGAQGGENRGYNGSIDDFVIFNRTLSDEELTYMYYRRAYWNIGVNITLGAEESAPSGAVSLNVSLVSPLNNTYTNLRNVNFTYVPSTSNANNITNASLWTNITSVFTRTQWNQTGVINGSLNGINSSLNNYEGSLIWNVQACAGNTCNFSEFNRTLIVDTIKPTISITAPLNNQYLNSKLISINGTVTDAYLNYTNISIYNLSGTLINSTINYSVIATLLGVQEDGNYTINITAYDNATNYNSTTINVTVDSTIPQLSFITPTEANNTYWSRNFISVNVSASDTNEANITFYLFNSTHTLNSTNLTAGSRGINFTNLNSNMQYWYNVTVRDLAGNSNTTETRTITLDTTNPSLLISSPINGTTYTTYYIDLNYSATDLNGISACWYSLDSGANTTIASCGNTTLKINNGLHNITVYANDSANNVNSSMVYFTISVFPNYINSDIVLNSTQVDGNQTIGHFVINASNIVINLNSSTLTRNLTWFDGSTIFSSNGFTNVTIRDGTLNWSDWSRLRAYSSRFMHDTTSIYRDALRLQLINGFDTNITLSKITVGGNCTGERSILSTDVCQNLGSGSKCNLSIADVPAPPGFEQEILLCSSLPDPANYTLTITLDTSLGAVTGIVKGVSYNSSNPMITTYYNDFLLSNSAVNLINITFNGSRYFWTNFSDSASNLSVGWYLDVQVNDLLGNNLSNANVTATDKNGVVRGNGTTDSNGRLRFSLPEYVQNSSGRDWKSNYTLNIIYGTSTGSKSLNLTGNTETAIILDTTNPDIIIRTYYNSTEQTSFSYQNNLTIRANVTDVNLKNVTVSIQRYNGSFLVTNASMNNITAITNGWVYEYNYTLNSSSYPGNYTITIFANDSAGNSASNKTTITVKLTVQIAITAPSSLQGNSIILWNKTHSLEGKDTDSSGIAIFSREFDSYYLEYQTPAGSGVWEMAGVQTAYTTITISGSSGGGAGSSGGGGPIVTYFPPREVIKPTEYLFDLTVVLSQFSNNVLTFYTYLKNTVNKSGEIKLRYSLISGSELINQQIEQVYVMTNLQSPECSLLVCPRYAQMYLPNGCVKDTILKVDAIEVDTNNIIASTENHICKVKESGENHILIQTTTTTIPITQNGGGIPVVFYAMLLLGIGGIISYFLYKN